MRNFKLLSLVLAVVLCAVCFVSCGEADGGYTRWNVFENPPEGWDWVKDVGSVCPECWKDFQRMMEQYKKKPPQLKED